MTPWSTSRLRHWYSHVFPSKVFPMFFSPKVQHVCLSHPPNMRKRNGTWNRHQVLTLAVKPPSVWPHFWEQLFIFNADQDRRNEEHNENRSRKCRKRWDQYLVLALRNLRMLQLQRYCQTDSHDSHPHGSSAYFFIHPSQPGPWVTQ